MCLYSSGKCEMLSPKGLQDIGENLTQDQAAGFLLRLIFLWPAFIIVWASSTTVAAALIEAVAGSGTIFGEHGVRLLSLYSLLAYALGFMAARVWYRSDFVRQRPVVGSLLGFASLIAAIWILKAIRPALGVLFGA